MERDDILDAPEYSSGPIEYAGFWLRVAAYIIDYFVIAVPSWILSAVVLGGAYFGGAGGSSIGVGYLFLQIIVVVGAWLYFTLLESSPRQATLGKQAVGIIVTDMDGQKISFAQASGRFFGKIISTIILGFGFFMAGFTEKKQALHDTMAGTLVIKKITGPFRPSDGQTV